MARAVIPPPRLRAKFLDFSALLRIGYSEACWGLMARLLTVENLQNPARVAVFLLLRLSTWRGVFLRWFGKKVRFASEVSAGPR